MREVSLHVPSGRGVEVARAAARRGAVAISRTLAHDADGDEVEVVTATVPNVVVTELIELAERTGPLEATVPSTSVFAVEPPADEPSEVLLDVTPRSAIEIVLAGQESAGSWRAFLSFAIAAGIVVWTGLYTEVVYLLTAAMLLAPFAGPAMNTALALASGHPTLLRNAVTRYAAGIAATAAASGVLTAVTQQQRITDLTTDVLTVSNVAVLLPLAAGVAGATYLVQSEHSSLVSGAAVGMLVAASLAPPAGGIGIAVVLGRTDLLAGAVFVVALQLVGITLTAGLVFRWYGVTPASRRATDVREGYLTRGLPIVALVVAALLAVQFLSGQPFQRSSLIRDVSVTVESLFQGRREVDLVRVDTTVPTQRIAGGQRLLIHVDLESAGTDRPTDQLEQAYAELIRRHVAGRFPDIVPLVDVTVHAPPGAG